MLRNSYISVGSSQILKEYSDIVQQKHYFVDLYIFKPHKRHLFFDHCCSMAFGCLGLFIPMRLYDAMRSGKSQDNK